jgi:hypothetical protein
MSSNLSVYQSRWGFHPCDYQTYRKLKFLNLAYLKAVRQARAWMRWKRKDPHNRVIRRRKRNDKGQTIGYEKPIPMPAPRICEVFSRKILEKCYVDKKGNYCKEGFMEEKVVMLDLGVAQDYAASRIPRNTKEEVVPLRNSLEAIIELFEIARSWAERQDVA